jgi:hypothetical protein
MISESFCVVKHEITPPYTPEYNGVVQWHQRSTNERLCMFMFEWKFPYHWWPELMKTAVYIFKCTMQKGIGETTPYERWHKKKPNIKHWRIIGCDAFVFNRNSGKLGNKTMKCNLLGYDNDFVYRLWNLHYHRVVQSRDVIFDKKNMHSSEELENILN